MQAIRQFYEDALTSFFGNGERVRDRDVFSASSLLLIPHS